MFQEIAVESAHSYLNYLKEEQKGVSEIAVTEIRQDIKNPELFSMTLYKHPYIDSMQIRINGHICKQNEIRPVKYNKKTRILIVRAISTFVDIMRTAEEKDVFISSDLTFLVERVENWYKQFGMMVQLPRTKQNVSYIQRESSKNPSPDQLAAIQGILKHPFTYIWGAPGTGKTQVVLSDAIISYIFANKKVLITAPTNNALEQTLYGLLPIMKEAGFDYDKLVIRLGTPSSDFAEKYPGVCENTAEAQRLSELNDRITLLNNRIIELEQLLSLFPKYRDYIVAMESLQRYTEEAPRIIEDLQRLNHLHEYHENEITRLEGRIALDTEDLDTLQKKMHRHTARIKLLTENIQKYDTALSKKLHAKRIREYSNELASLLTDEETVKKELEDKKDTVNENRQEIISHKKEIDFDKKTMSTRLDELLSLSSFNERLYGRIKAFGVHINQEIHAELKALVEDLQRLTVKEEVVFTRIKDVTEADLRERTDALKLELTDCVSLKMSVENTGGFSKRAEKCLVFAATVDCCLNRLLPNEEHCFSHVFLDEAGYCSLIKGCTLFAYDTPVTFLGDHMQLPPICEMNDSIIKQNGNWPVFLWAQSAIYAESVFRKELSEAYTDYIKRRDIQLEYTKQYDLIMTYRFGPTLAAILRDEVYAKEFYAAGTHETELYYINAPKPMNSKDHESATECQQIEDYVVNNGSEQIGIITPYRAQYGMIKNRMRNYKELTDSLLTVHKSQGREWDTVLFSIADTTTHFFIDSLIKTSDGKKLVNTAVSRARKKLIIVCDYDYWITQKKQLICKILEKANPYND